MKLTEYLQKHEIPIADFAKLNGVSVFAVRKWIYGQRIPRPKLAAKIMRLTGGKVDANSWLPDDD